MAERSVIGQSMGCYWLLKLAPFCSGFAITAAIDVASVVAIGVCDNGEHRGAVGDIVNALKTHCLYEKLIFP